MRTHPSACCACFGPVIFRLLTGAASCVGSRVMCCASLDRLNSIEWLEFQSSAQVYFARPHDETTNAKTVPRNEYIVVSLVHVRTARFVVEGEKPREGSQALLPLSRSCLHQGVVFASCISAVQPPQKRGCQQCSLAQQAGGAPGPKPAPVYTVAAQNIRPPEYWPMFVGPGRVFCWGRRSWSNLSSGPI